MTLKHITFSILFSLGLSSFGVAAPPKNCKLMVHGDSLSAAYGLKREEGWVSLLEKKLSADKIDCAVVNTSISGETTAGGLARLPALLAQHKPSHVLLELGGNDGLRGLPLNEMNSNLLSMVNQAQQAQAQVLLIGVQIPPNYGRPYNEKFQQTFKDVAKAKRVALVPSLLEKLTDSREAFQADGIHPQASAQPALLDTVWPQLKLQLKK
jgi:acyl-CoA thioesterase-1